MRSFEMGNKRIILASASPRRKELMAMAEIDGGLIGGASLKAPDFAAIVNFDK